MNATAPRLLIKICGLKTEETVEAAIAAGADMLGFNFFPKSPRYVPLDDAWPLFWRARGRTKTVALLVNPDILEVVRIDGACWPDIWQYHGSESADQLKEAASGGSTIMKAIGVATSADIDAVPAYAAVADYILLDAKPPRDAAYPGGHGRPFDWTILATLPPALPFMLSGGLVPENVGQAIRTVRGMGLNLAGVDVSSGVESAPGVKDAGRIRAFVAAVRETERQMAEGAR